jgi:hypothetical protein
MVLAHELRAVALFPALLEALLLTSLPAQAQGSPQAPDWSPRAACALSGQAADAGTFDPNQVEFVPNPRPVEFEGRTVSLKRRVIARVVGLRPLVFEVLDTEDDRLQPPRGPCERERVYTVDSRLREVLGTLRFQDLVRATSSFAEGGFNDMVLTELEKIQGAPVYFHPQAGSGGCSNRAGMLVQYYKRSGETVIINNDGSIYFRDAQWRTYDKQRVEPVDLTNLMHALGDAGFNAFPSQKWEVGDHSGQPYVALACTRFQKVLIPDHEQALEPVEQIMEKVKAKALSDTYYLLLYRERGQIELVDWPFPRLPLEQFEALKWKAREAERQAKAENRPVQGDFAVFHQQVPLEFFAKVPVDSAPLTRDQDPNRNVYFRDGQKLYRVGKGPAFGSEVGTMYALAVQEVVSADVAIARQRPGGIADTSSHLASNSNSFSTSYLWPEGMGVELKQVPAKGQPITNAEYSGHESLYGDLLATQNGGRSGEGVTFVEGGFVYYDVRLTRVERSAP